MMLKDLEKKLPNGLHDAQICSFTRDLENETLTLAVRVLVGLPGDPPETRSAYRDAHLKFKGVKCFVAESPDVESAFFAPGSVFFSADQGERGALPAALEERLRGITETYSFFVLDWMSSIHVAASEMTFDWVSS